MSAPGERIVCRESRFKISRGQDIDSESCNILEQSGLASTNRLLDLGAAKHKQNTRSITDYRIFSDTQHKILKRKMLSV